MSYVTDWYDGVEITVYPSVTYGITPYNHVFPANPWEDDLTFSQRPTIIHAAVINTGAHDKWEVWGTHSDMGSALVDCCWNHAIHGSTQQDITVFVVNQDMGSCAAVIPRHLGGGFGGGCGLATSWETVFFLFTTFQADASVQVAQWSFDLQQIVEYESWREVGGWTVTNEVSWPAGATSFEWEGQNRRNISNDDGPYAELLEVVLDPSTLHGTPDEWGGNNSVDYSEVNVGHGVDVTSSPASWTANYSLVMADMGELIFDPLDAESVINSPDFYLANFQDYCTNAQVLGTAVVPGGDVDLSGLTAPGLFTLDQATLKNYAPVVPAGEDPRSEFPAPPSWNTWLNLLVSPDLLIPGVRPAMYTGGGSPDESFYYTASRQCNFPGDLWGAYTIRTPRFRFLSDQQALTVADRSNGAEFWPN